VHANRGDDASAYFLVGLYPSDRLQVLAYNRVVHSLGARSTAQFLEAVGQSWSVTSGVGNTPSERGDVRMYLDGAWYGLQLKAALRSDHPVASLDCAALQTHLLSSLLGIDDPRTSHGIRFIGGIHGPQALESAVDAGAAVAFHLYPTGLDQLFVVADAGQVMPPKSTWFEPKLREGVAIRLLERGQRKR
jgi:uncharacterized protein (DUF1015 family)